MRNDTSVAAEDIRRSRTGAGLSLRAASKAAGIDHATLWRFERGMATALSVEEIAAVGAVVGLDVRLRAYPAGDPIRDAGQQQLLERLRRILHPSLGWRTEVPLPDDGDRRTWDAMIRAAIWRMAVDAETVLADVQSVERRFNLKAADSGSDLALLLVADTRRNRRALAAAPTAFGGLDRNARPLLRALRRGARPPGSAIVLL
jgi:transcriptional regulator with XRE-family HTH domain